MVKQEANLGYDEYIGRLGIGRITKGKIKSGETVSLVKNNGKYNIVDVNGDYVSKNEWFDAITDYCWYNRLDFVKGRGYVIVFKKIDKVLLIIFC